MNDLYWHFLREDRCMQHPPHTLVEAGSTYTAVGPLWLCGNGMHASVQAIDALEYAPGNIVCRVRLGEERVSDTDKVCARERTVLWMADAAPVLHEFSCLLAQRALDHATERGHPPDPRSTAVLVAKRAWLRGELDDAALDAAGVQAKEASRDAHGAASEADWGSAWAAAKVAARDTIYEVIKAAVWIVTRDAVPPMVNVDAFYEARAIAGGIARAAINAEFEPLLDALAPPERTAA
jgi:hypothetical protein